MDFRMFSCTILIFFGFTIRPNYAGISSGSLTKEKIGILLFGNKPHPELNGEEKFAFLKLQARVDDLRRRLPQDEPYPYDDYHFLLRFLSAKDFNVEEAFQAWVEHVKWRLNNDINDILKEDWSDMEKNYPYSNALLQSKSSTLKDRVTLHIPFGLWDMYLSNVVELSEEERLRYSRYALYRMMEDVSQLARSLANCFQSTGKDSSKFHVVVDLKGSDYGRENGEIAELVTFAEHFGKHYKEAIDHVIFINVHNVPLFTCTWLSEGNLTCPTETPYRREDILNRFYKLD